MKVFCKLNLFQTIIFIIGLSSVSFAQGGDTIDLFLDCDCDKNYIRQEISFVNHVRDQYLASVQLFVFDIQNGSGGRTFNLEFSGKGKFEGLNYALKYQTTPTLTEDGIRSGLKDKIALGLLGYLIKTNMGDKIKFTVTDTLSGKSHKTNMDKWKNWVFEIYGEAEFEKETSRREFDYELGLDIDKVTQKWRIRSSLEYTRSGSVFINDGERFESSRKKIDVQTSAVLGLTNHWSTGLFVQATHDTFNNIQFSYNIQPALEYNIFPYDEVLNKEVTFAYRVGMIDNHYIERTVYEKQKEILCNHSLNLEVRFRQKGCVI